MLDTGESCIAKDMDCAVQMKRRKTKRTPGNKKDVN
jgi:hypothetical protein